MTASVEGSAFKPCSLWEILGEDLGPIALVGADRMRALAAKPVDWAWQDYVAAGTIALLAGPPSGGKTTLLFLVLIARATTGDPLQRLGRSVAPAPPGKSVVLIEGEHGEASTARKLLKSAELLELNETAANAALNRLIVVARKAVTLGSPAWGDVEELIAAGRVSDIAIDTIARVAPGDGNSESEQARIFDQVAQALEKAPTGAQPTAWLIAHTRKGNGDDLDAVAGSIQRVGQSDAVLMVRAERDQETAQVTASTIKLLKAREDPAQWPDPVTLTISDGTLTVSEPEARAACKPEEMESVREAIEKAGTVGSVKALAKELGIRNATVYAACRVLEKEGFLVPRPKKNGRTNGWDLAS